MQRNVLKQITNIILVAAFLLPHSVVLAEAIHEERSKYRDITVTQVGDRRCLLFNVHRGDRNQTCMMDDRDLLVFDLSLIHI